jgi:hypothetical protein
MDDHQLLMEIRGVLFDIRDELVKMNSRSSSGPDEIQRKILEGVSKTLSGSPLEGVLKEMIGGKPNGQ